MTTARSLRGVLALAAGAAACTNEPGPVPPPPVPSQEECPAGFGPLAPGLPDGCYALLDEPLDWESAEERCEAFESLGTPAHLIVIDREVEHVAVSEMAYNAIGVWTGRLQRSPDDDWRNINYVEYDPEYFGPGEPNDYGEDCDWFSCDGAPGLGDERCIEYADDTGRWNDEWCGDHNVVICEWDGLEPQPWRPHDSE